MARSEPEAGAEQPRSLGRPEGVTGPQLGGQRRREQTEWAGSKRDTCCVDIDHGARFC